MQYVFEKENVVSLKIPLCKPLMFLAIAFEKGLLRIYCPLVSYSKLLSFFLLSQTFGMAINHIEIP